MNLETLSAEYFQQELEVKKMICGVRKRISSAQSAKEKENLRRRLLVLYSMANDCRGIAYHLKNYYGCEGVN